MDGAWCLQRNEKERQLRPELFRFLPDSLSCCPAAEDAQNGSVCVNRMREGEAKRERTNVMSPICSTAVGTLRPGPADKPSLSHPARSPGRRTLKRPLKRSAPRGCKQMQTCISCCLDTSGAALQRRSATVTGSWRSFCECKTTKMIKI